MKNKNITIVAGALMAVASLINYYLNEDIISLGIFGFSGIAFINIGIAETRKDKSSAARMRKFAGMFFFAAFAVFAYWLVVGKLKWL